jgi:cytochrome c oxidase subunit III
MALGTLSPDFKISRERPRPGAGGRPPLDRPRDGYGGGGGGGRGDGNPDYHELLQRYRLGLAIALVSVFTVFFCIGSAFVLRAGFSFYDPATGNYVRNWQPMPLPIRLLWLNTIVLATSSITLEFARRQAKREAALAPALRIPGIANDHRAFPWLPITIVLGIAFLTGQTVAWRAVSNSLSDSGVSTSFFYILTGTHAVHLLAGILALFYALTLAWKRKPYAQRRIVVDVTSWYWHVIGALWIFLFALIALAN